MNTDSTATDGTAIEGNDVNDVNNAALQDARRRHYGAFYGPDEAPDGVAIVVGNCQAESLRIMLEGPDLPTVRIPAVHELTLDDMPYLERLLRRVRLFISQPIRNGYHGLPLGTAELLARLHRGAQSAVVPVVRHSALYPTQVIVRDHSRPAAEPPIVVYHDLRELARAGGVEVRVTASAITSIAAASTDELRRRELLHDTVAVSDLFESPRFDTMRTMNHPGNSIFATIAERVRASAGLPSFDVDPGRRLLDSIHAPREAEVIAAWGLDDEPTDHWMIGGTEVPVATVEDAHRQWYRDNPLTVAFALDRHAATLRMVQA